MKKNLLRNALAAIVVATAATLASCGDKNPASQVDAIVGEAEKNVAEEESPCLGSIPSLQMQYSEAQKLLDEKMKQRTEEAEQKFKDGGSMEDVFREVKKMKDEKKALQHELERIYTERIMAEAKKLEGKSVECEVDGRRFSKAVVKLVCSKDSSTTSPLIVEAELTLKAPYSGLVGYCSWQYRDANGHELSSGASPVDDSGKYKAGDTIRQSFPLAVTQEKAKSLAKIYFTE